MPPFPKTLLLLFLLAACSQAPSGGELGNAVPPTAVATPLPTPTATTPADRPFTESQIGLSFNLPADWVVGESEMTTLGRLVLFGPAPLGPGPASSTLLIAPAAELDAQTAAMQLQCGGDCPEAIDWRELTIDGRPARLTLIGADGPAPLEWYFVEHNGYLLYFTFHDSATLLSRQDILASIRLSDAAAVALIPSLEATVERPSPTIRPSSTPQPSPTPIASPTLAPDPSATPSPVPVTPQPAPTAVPSFTPLPATTATLPPTPLTIALDFYQAVYDDPAGQTAVPYLSNRLRAEVAAGQTLLALIGIEHRYTFFSVAWDAPASGGRITIPTTLIYGDGTELARITTLIFEEDGWRIDAIDPR